MRLVFLIVFLNFIIMLFLSVSDFLMGDKDMTSPTLHQVILFFSEFTFHDSVHFMILCSIINQYSVFRRFCVAGFLSYFQ